MGKKIREEQENITDVEEFDPKIERKINKFQKKFCNWIYKGLKKGKIEYFPKEYFRRLVNVYYDGLPAQVVLFLPEFCALHDDVVSVARVPFGQSYLFTALTNTSRLFYGKNSDGTPRKLNQYLVVLKNGEPWVLESAIGLLIKESWYKKFEKPKVYDVKTFGENENKFEKSDKNFHENEEDLDNGEYFIEEDYEKDYVFLNETVFPKCEDKIMEHIPEILKFLNSPSDAIQKYYIEYFDLIRVFGEFKEDFYDYLQAKAEIEKTTKQGLISSAVKENKPLLKTMIQREESERQDPENFDTNIAKVNKEFEENIDKQKVDQTIENKSTASEN